MDSFIDAAAFGNTPPAGPAPVAPGPDAGLIRSLKADLRDASAPIEATFLTVGETLSRTLEHMRAIGERFRALSLLIDNEDGVQATRRLGNVREVTDGLASSLRRTLTELTELDKAGTDMAGLLGSLSQIIGEITALAINAKVQSVQIRSGSDDFSVFNREIDRLHRLAETAVTQATGRLACLRETMTAAKNDADAFQRDNLARLGDVGRRLQGSLDRLTAYRGSAQTAAQRFVHRVDEIGRRIARCISDLQVGDFTCQRLAHIAEAVDVLALLADPSPTSALPSDLRWLAELEQGRRADLSAAVCRLQIHQYREASDDFGAQVASLKGNLDALARDADMIAREATELFGSSDGAPHGERPGGESPAAGRSVLHDVAGEVDHALELLHHYRRCDDMIRKRVVEISNGFAVMDRDVLAIRSVDTDMRLMGLNTTLKCARLGMAGRALSVVAQELRACSRRTEDVSQAITQAIGAAAEQANGLDRRSGSNHQLAMDLVDAMGKSMDCLKRVHAGQMRDLSAMTGDCLEASKMLTVTVGRLDIERRLGGFAQRFAERMQPHAGDGADSLSGLSDDMARLFAKLYTGDREREIHAALFGGGVPPAGPSRAAEVDEFFL
ncbi:hypothetical protein AZL_a08680 (plasmid) [Azospirillum sp. B510]|uniref:hypothetical protein n=1 Tax=Azospirillum sp. (strain B510) TaxID=137722 RepID=UPI0001C4BB9C|nr:hypothetical protein [Azospirillum sp. B510]BAI74399.1 hypothetical protein AZL_a08680 [Azospirillum sp. B510]